jgi:hypothetical protein
MNRINPETPDTPTPKTCPPVKKLIMAIVNELANNANIAKVVPVDDIPKFLEGFTARVHAVSVREVESWDADFKNQFIAACFQDEIRRMLMPHLMVCLMTQTSVVAFIEGVRDTVLKEFAETKNKQT